MGVTVSQARTVADTIKRSLSDEPDSVVRVAEADKLRKDLDEYVLTDHLARDFVEVLEPIVEAARPPGHDTGKIGIWVSGFFGSGKSHFAKVAGHLLANTPLDATGTATARDAFRRQLHLDKPADNQLGNLLQQATTHHLKPHLVAFDIQAFHSHAADLTTVGLTFLRAFYESLGLSKVVAFAEREIDLQEAGRYQEFLRLYEERFGVPWAEDRDFNASSSQLADCLATLMPERYSSAELAHQSLEFSLDDLNNLTIDNVVDRLLRWLDRQGRTRGPGPGRLIFVADEVGAWAGRDLSHIEQIRGFVKRVASEGKGRIWLLVTSQEKLSDVVQNAPWQDNKSAAEFLQRLEARFRINIHLESSEVGTVIEQRILLKSPSARPALETLWSDYQQQLRDVAEPPGLELQANYPRADREPFLRTYPFLPYQLPAAADIFGSMRGVKISSGARSMIKVVFDATRDLAQRELGAVVPWDQIFDSANQDNEFADEAYLGSQGLRYIETADRDVDDTALTPSRVLKALWLVQRQERIPRTPRNLARLLVDRLDVDVLRLERQVEEALAALEDRSYVRQDITTGQWRFLSQDEVTVEKIVADIADKIRQNELRDEKARLYGAELQRQFPGKIRTGRSNTTFEYAVLLNDTPLTNDRSAVQLSVVQTGTPVAERARADSAANLERPVVYWEVETSDKLDARLRRAMAIERLENNDDFRRVATERTKREAEKLRVEDAAQLRRDAATDVEQAFSGGTLYWAGQVEELPTGSSRRAGPSAKSRVEEALRDRIITAYFRFEEGDRTFNEKNIAKLFTAAPGDRAALDPDLGLFSADGHVQGQHVLVEDLVGYLNSTSKTSGTDVAAHFSEPPFGWQPDLLRYVAAAMFVDGMLSVVDRAGNRHEDPRTQAARNLFGTNPFKTTRLEVESMPLDPATIDAARRLLGELRRPSTDPTEIAVGDAIQLVLQDLTKRQAVIDAARQVDFPLPAIYDEVATTLDAIAGAESRRTLINAFVAHADALRQADTALVRLEDFRDHYRLAQYQRSQQLLGAALLAGLAEDPTWGTEVQRAQTEIEAIKSQRRVLDDWSAQYERYREDVLRAFRETYRPLREQVHKQVSQARAAILEMPEFTALPAGDRSIIRVQYLNEGKPLAEVSLPELRDEEQLLAAHAEYSVGHLRSTLAALDAQVSAARAAVLERQAVMQEQAGVVNRTVVWKPAEAFAGMSLSTAEEIQAVFDAERDRLMELVRTGKIIQIV